ncbi:MAG: pyruvate formate lyase family protein [Anaerolineae bacterium]
MTDYLDAKTHLLAERALHGEWGRSMVDAPLTLANNPELDGKSAEQRYAAAIKLIAEQAPLRIDPNELLVGAATLQQATFHRVPVYLDGKPEFYSISHVTLGFGRALKFGYQGLRNEINDRLARGGLDARGIDLLTAMQTCLDAAKTWHQRYMQALDGLIAETTGAQQAHYESVRAALAPVPEQTPQTFRQAVQSLWLLFDFQRLCGNWPGIGRIDEMLGPYLDHDLASGAITLSGARELLAHLWIKGCEWVGSRDTFTGSSGDGQYYQNIVLAGCDAAGHEVANAVTYLILDVVEELAINDYPIAVRISSRSPERLLRRIAEVQRRGGGMVAVYNEDLIISSLQHFGYSQEEARSFANDGCWEIQVPGKTQFAYRPFDTLTILQKVLGVTNGHISDYPDFKSLYTAYRTALINQVQAIHAEADRFATNGTPSALVSLLTEDCIERGRGYTDRGAHYNVYAPHAGGLPDTGNALLAIKRLVYDEKQMTLMDLVECLRNDWSGHEVLRLQIRSRYPTYGNGDADADAMTKRVFDDFLAAVEAVHERNGVLRPAGVSTFGREIEWRPQRGASADGHHAGDILATNFSPSPGTDRQGPTAVIASHCAMDLVRLPNGTALEIKLHPSALAGEEGVESLIGLLRTFLQLGGIFMHVDVIDNAVLREAQEHPDRYPTLAVRVSGWSARFVTLSKDWQEMIINRSTQVT